MGSPSSLLTLSQGKAYARGRGASPRAAWPLPSVPCSCVTSPCHSLG